MYWSGAIKNRSKIDLVTILLAVPDCMEQATRTKWSWSGHLARRNDERWIKIECNPAVSQRRKKKRKTRPGGRTRSSWCLEQKRIREAHDMAEWKRHVDEVDCLWLRRRIWFAREQIQAKMCCGLASNINNKTVVKRSYTKGHTIFWCGTYARLITQNNH